jgi:hypothetical protein
MSPLTEAIAEVTATEAPQVAEPEAEPGAAAPGSVLAALRTRAQQLRESHTTDIDVPGYDGMLVARYKAVSLPRVFARASDFQTPINPDWTLAADTLGMALVELLMRGGPDNSLHPLFTDIPARFDDDLVECLGLRPAERTARAVLVALCGGGALGESRVWSHYMAYQGWLMAGADTGTTIESEVASAAVGESTGR